MACRVSATLIGRCLCLRLFVCFCRFVALSPCRACFSSLRPTVKRVACGGIYLLFCYLHIPSPQWCVFFFVFLSAIVSLSLCSLRIFDISLCALRVFLFVLSASSCLTIMLSILVALFLSFLLVATVFHILFLLAIAALRFGWLLFHLYTRGVQWAPK